MNFQLRFKINEKLFIRNPEGSELGNQIVKKAIDLIYNLGFEQFTFKKLAVEMNPKYVFQSDSDDQFEVNDFIKFWEKRDQSEFILGFREVRHDDPFRLLITRFLKFSLLFIYGVYIKDANIPFRLIKTSFLDKLIKSLPIQTPFAPNIFISVMAKKANQDIFNIPVIHRERETGVVSIRHFKLLKVCWQSFKELLDFRIKLNQIVKGITS
jgi:hypothetical protein